jgi:regulatory protein
MDAARAQSPEPRAADEPPAVSAYSAGLAMLSRRELSERQIRQRLARKEYEAVDIDQAIERLKSNGSLNDARVAAAIARTQTSVKGRGRIRVRQQIQQAGIGGELAKQAVDDVFGDIDDQALLEAALGKRLKDGQTIADERTFQRLYRYLVTQGFESDRVLKALSARRPKRGRFSDDPLDTP